MERVREDPVITAECFFKKIYLRNSILICRQAEDRKRKRDSSQCAYRAPSGEIEYGQLEKICYSPPVALIRPHRKRSSVLLAAGDAGNSTLSSGVGSGQAVQAMAGPLF